MFDTTKLRAPAGSASAFVASTEPRVSRFDIRAEAGRAIELGYRAPTQMGEAVRVAVVVGLVVVAKLCSAWVLR
jgi:hypothetical protein